MSLYIPSRIRHTRLQGDWSSDVCSSDLASAEGLVIPAGLSGKIKTTVQIISIALLIIYNQLGEFRHLAPISLWATLLITAYSGIEYFFRFGRLIFKGEVPIHLSPPSGPRQ